MAESIREPRPGTAPPGGRRRPSPGRLLAVASVVLLALASCNQSELDPDAAVSIAGTVQREDGTAVSETRVALMKEPSAGDVFTGVLTIGLTCLESDLSACGEQRVATTGGEGSFDYELEGRDVQGSFGEASIMELATALDRAEGQLAGPGVNTRFQVQTDAVRIPLRIWETPVELTGAGANVRASWTDPPPDAFPPEANLGDLTRRVVFRAGPDELVWGQDAPGPSLELDARILEDTRGDVAVYSEVDDILTEPGSGTDVEVLLRSGRYGYASPAGAPPSRGGSCSVGDVTQSPCTLTDGGFSDTFDPVTCPPADEACVEPDHREVTIDLGSSMDVAFVVLRGCGGTCTVETSEDRRAWQVVGASDGDLSPRDIAVPASGPARGRYVRVASAERVDTLREVSVWDAQPASAEGSLLVSPDDVSGGLGPGDGGEDGGPPWGLLILGVVVLLGVIAVVVVVVRRRSRPASG